jgi:predicted nuclease of predicted toxin-antitoxin system
VRFKIDENLPAELAELLHLAGHDVETVHGEGLSGASDPDIIQVCRIELRCLITLDLDFSDMRAYPPAKMNGMIVMRLRSQDKRSVRAVASRLIPLLEREVLENRLWIVDEERLRIRAGN